jgi:hypothetical protein
MAEKRYCYAAPGWPSQAKSMMAPLQAEGSWTVVTQLSLMQAAKPSAMGRTTLPREVAKRRKALPWNQTGLALYLPAEPHQRDQITRSWSRRFQEASSKLIGTRISRKIDTSIAIGS